MKFVLILIFFGFSFSQSYTKFKPGLKLGKTNGDVFEIGILDTDTVLSDHLGGTRIGSFLSVELGEKNKYSKTLKSISYGLFKSGTGGAWGYDIKLKYHFTNNGLSISPGISIMWFRLALNIRLIKSLDKNYRFFESAPTIYIPF